MKCPTPDCLFTSTLFLTPMLGFEDPHRSADIDFLCSAGMLLTNNGMERMFVNIRWTLPVDFKTIDQGSQGVASICSPAVFAARRAAQI